jgi:hypothetical protein
MKNHALQMREINPDNPFHRDEKQARYPERGAAASIR